MPGREIKEPQVYYHTKENTAFISLIMRVSLFSKTSRFLKVKILRKHKTSLKWKKKKTIRTSTRLWSSRHKLKSRCLPLKLNPHKYVLKDNDFSRMSERHF